MTAEMIKKETIEILEDICTENISDLSAELVNDLSMDSLRMVMLLVMIEDRFDIELDETDMNPFALITVQDVVSLVLKYKEFGEEK